MPPRPASRCRRALQSQVVSARDNVWISDGQLAAAFERYCCISRQVRRKASNVPGPLESRRRLGRRQIAALNAIHNTQSLPLWALSNTADLTRWQWQAPSSASEREERQSHQTQTNFSSEPWVTWPSSVRQWVCETMRLGNASQPAPTAVAETSGQQPQPAQSLTKLAETGINSASLEEDIARFRALPTNTNMDLVVSDFHQLVDQFRQSLYLGHITEKDLPSLAGQLWKAFDARWAGCPSAGSLGLSLHAAILSGITSSPTLNLAAVEASLWNSLLVQISKLPANDELSRLFERIMHSIPETRLALISDGILSVLRTFFSSWTSATNAYADLAHTLRLIEETISMDTQIQAIASALRHVSQLEHGELVEEALRLLPTPDPADLERSHQVRYAWLSVMAHMPLVQQEFMLDIGTRLGDIPGAQELDIMEICSLALSQWNSRGYLLPESMPDLAPHLYQVVWFGKESTVLASLFSVIFDLFPPNYRGLFVSLFLLLKGLGPSHDVVDSFRALASSLPASSSPPTSSSDGVRVSLLQEVALAAKDHNIAMSIHRLYKYHLYTPGGPEWDPAVFRGYVRTMVLDPNLPPAAIWESLDIDMHEPGPHSASKFPRSVMTRHRGDFGEQRAKIIQELALGFSLAPHLRNRVALRHVSQCIHFLTAYDGKVPVSALKAIYQVVSRDLAKGRPGRTTRLQWFMSLISQHMGAEEAERCGLLLERWRHTAKTNYKEQGMPDTEPSDDDIW
ncbi:hypothetical protein GQ53DRAFT_661699 [Thozetella sp. PMI_491]|nr:hypothetical protein GQ53DRAFT_661699 [Thozetella sp. PMI_491]